MRTQPPTPSMAPDRRQGPGHLQPYSVSTCYYDKGSFIVMITVNCKLYNSFTIPITIPI